MERTKLIFINGTMGAGKTAVCRALQKKIPPNVLLDGDDCRNMRPFAVNAATKVLVTDNICALLNNYIGSGLFDNVLFCWVMHERAIVDGLLGRLRGAYGFRLFTLTCSEKALRRRLAEDIAAGRRDAGIIERSLERAAHYQNMGGTAIDTTDLSAEQAAARIARMLLDEDFSFRIFNSLPAEAKAIREAVFVQEQGFAQEFDARDPFARHILLYYRGRAAGTCRFWQEGADAHIGRVAVKREMRGFGAGGRLLAAAESAARAAGAARAVLDAQVRAAAFYIKCGYSACSEVFAEEGCPHVRMQKALEIANP